MMVLQQSLYLEVDTAITSDHWDMCPHKCLRLCSLGRGGGGRKGGGGKGEERGRGKGGGEGRGGGRRKGERGGGRGRGERRGRGRERGGGGEGMGERGGEGTNTAENSTLSSILVVPAHPIPACMHIHWLD